MANYQLDQTGAEVQAILDAVQNKETTRPVLNSSKLITSGAVRNALAEGYLYKGVADHTTNPGAPTEKVFYIASDPGTYSNFGTGISVAEGEVAILKYDTAWHKEVTGAATAAQVTELGQYTKELSSGLNFIVDIPSYLKSEENYSIRGSNGNIQSDSGFAYAIVNVEGYKKIRFRGLKSAWAGATYAGYAFGTYVGGVWTPTQSFKFDYDAGVTTPGGILTEYNIEIPAGTTHFATTIKTNYNSVPVLNAGNFFIYLIKGDNIADGFKKVDTEIKEFTDGMGFSVGYPDFLKVEDNYDIRGSNGNITSANHFAYGIVPVSGYKKVRFLGIVSSQTVNYYAGYAFGTYINGVWTPLYSYKFDYDANKAAAGELKEYLVDVPDGVTHFAVTIQTYYSNTYILTKTNFYLRLIRGRNVAEEIQKELADYMTETKENNNVTFEQTSRQPAYQSFNLKAGVTYYIYMKFSGISDANIDNYTGLRLYSYPDNNHIVTTLNGFSHAVLKSGEYAMVEYTPPQDISALRNIFNADFVEQSGTSVNVYSTFSQSKYLSSEDVTPGLNPLFGKNVVMFGDSITQLPKTGTSVAGNGIVEYFAEDSGANVVRGAFGGSHLSARAILNSPADIVSRTTAIAAFDLPYIIRAFVNSDFSLQEAALTYSETYLPDADKLDAYWRTILDDLEAITLSNIDFVTILSGINDYSGSGVVIGDESDAGDITTIYGAWEDILTNLSTANVNVFVFTPLPYRSDIADPATYCPVNGQNLKLTDYVDANLEAAKRYNYPGCDLFHTIGINNNNFTNYYTDGTHPKTGFPFIAMKMCQFISSNYNR